MIAYPFFLFWLRSCFIGQSYCCCDRASIIAVPFIRKICDNLSSLIFYHNVHNPITIIDIFI